MTAETVDGWTSDGGPHRHSLKGRKLQTSPTNSDELKQPNILHSGHVFAQTEELGRETHVQGSSDAPSLSSVLHDGAPAWLGPSLTSLSSCSSTNEARKEVAYMLDNVVSAQTQNFQGLPLFLHVIEEVHNVLKETIMATVDVGMLNSSDLPEMATVLAEVGHMRTAASDARECHGQVCDCLREFQEVPMAEDSDFHLKLQESEPLVQKLIDAESSLLSLLVNLGLSESLASNWLSSHVAAQSAHHRRRQIFEKAGNPPSPGSHSSFAPKLPRASYVAQPTTASVRRFSKNGNAQTPRNLLVDDGTPKSYGARGSMVYRMEADRWDGEPGGYMALCSPVSLNARNSSIGEGNADMEDYVGSQWTANSAGLLDSESRGMFHDTSTSYLSTISSSAAPKRKRMKRRCCSKPKGTASQATTWPVSPTHPKGFFRVSRWVHRVEDTDGTELPVRCVPENRPLPKDFWSDVVPMAPSLGPSSLNASWTSLPQDELRDHLYRLREEMEEFADLHTGTDMHVEDELRGRASSMRISGSKASFLARKPKMQKLQASADDPEKQPLAIKFAARLSAVRAVLKLNGASASEKLGMSDYVRKSLTEELTIPNIQDKIQKFDSKRSTTADSRKSTTAGSNRSLGGLNASL